MWVLLLVEDCYICRTVGSRHLLAQFKVRDIYIFHAKQKNTWFVKTFRRKQKKNCHGWPASNNIYRTNWIILPDNDRWPALILRLAYMYVMDMSATLYCTPYFHMKPAIYIFVSNIIIALLNQSYSNIVILWGTYLVQIVSPALHCQLDYQWCFNCHTY